MTRQIVTHSCVRRAQRNDCLVKKSLTSAYLGVILFVVVIVVEGEQLVDVGLIHFDYLSDKKNLSFGVLTKKKLLDAGIGSVPNG